MTTMDPYAQAAWDMEIAKFRKAIGQAPEEPAPPVGFSSYHGQLGAYSIAPLPQNHHWHQHWAAVTPAAARAIMGMPMYFPTPSPWDRLKGMVVELRTRLALVIGGEKVLRSDDCY